MIGALVAVGIIGVASLFFGNKLLSGKSAKLSDLRLQAQVLNNQQTALVQAKRDVIKYTPLDDIAQTVVPQEKDQALAVREIINFANQAHIAIASINFPASTLGGTESSSIGGSPTTVSPSVTKIPSQLLPAPGLAGIYVLPITIQSDANNPITYNQLSTFLQALEHNRHTAEVSQLTITPADNTGQHLSFEIIINIYIKK
jgi:hypothetical protein